MIILTSVVTPPFSIPNQNPTRIRHKPYPNSSTTCMVSIKPPPPEFDFRTQFLPESRALIAQTHPELLDLANNGDLVVIRKSQFGPVPIWRTQFVEPEIIWLIGTNHISTQSQSDVERVVRAVQPDNVVVELCRSRQVIVILLDFVYDY